MTEIITVHSVKTKSTDGMLTNYIVPEGTRGFVTQYAKLLGTVRIRVDAPDEEYHQSAAWVDLKDVQEVT